MNGPDLNIRLHRSLLRAMRPASNDDAGARIRADVRRETLRRPAQI